MPKRIQAPYLTADADGVTLSIKFAAALLKWASRDATRPAFSGIAADRAHIAATDGHRALRALLPGGGTAQRGVWVRAAVEREIALAKATKAATIRLDYAKLADDQPPAFSGVFDFTPDAPTQVFSLNPDYLADLAPVSDALTEGGDVEMRITVGDKYQPVRFSWCVRGDSKVEGLIMPVRLSDSKSEAA